MIATRITAARDPKVFANKRGMAWVGDKADCGAVIAEDCPKVSKAGNGACRTASGVEWIRELL